MNLFIANIVEPVEQERLVNPLGPDMHPEIHTMWKLRGHYSTSNMANFSTNAALVYHRDKLVIPMGLRTNMIWAVHTMAHVGLLSTLKTLPKLVYLLKMEREMEILLTDCVGCLHKFSSNLKKGKYYAKKLPTHKLHVIYVDLIGTVTMKSARKYLFYIINAFLAM